MAEYGDEGKELVPEVDPLDAEAMAELGKGLSVYSRLKKRKLDATLDEAIELLRAQDIRDTFYKSAFQVISTWMKLGGIMDDNPLKDFQGWKYEGGKESIEAYISMLKEEAERAEAKRKAAIKEEIEAEILEEHG